MRKVQIMIEVEVPDGIDSIAINRYGDVFGFPYGSNPINESNSWTISDRYYSHLKISNWKDTLTKVED